MEYYTNDQHGLIEELLSLREMELYTNQEFNNNACFEEFFLPLDQAFPDPFGNDLYSSNFAVNPPSLNLDTQTHPYRQETADFNHSISFLDDENGGLHNLDTGAPPEPRPVSGKVKKLNGQPSKNLMAERRRRKRLNDRLSLLRSVVPKISKMDRTSILGDTIDYMKELLERINNLKQEMDFDSNQSSMITIFNNVQPSETTVRNSPKFEVERRNQDTKIEMCCGMKPELLVSTVATLEALGLEIQHCVISCFSDFVLQASCSEDLKKAVFDSEEIKQTLLRNAGYGGKCL